MSYYQRTLGEQINIMLEPRNKNMLFIEYRKIIMLMFGLKDEDIILSNNQDLKDWTTFVDFTIDNVPMRLSCPKNVDEPMSLIATETGMDFPIQDLKHMIWLLTNFTTQTNKKKKIGK